MRTIIVDGYNVLLGLGLLKKPRPDAPLARGQLQRAREDFLGRLSSHISKSFRNQMVIVFDSAMRLPELPDQYVHNGMEVRYASGHLDADEMIVEWLKKHSVPKKVLVVSSDHQIQTAASRRKSGFVDSVKWFESYVEAGKYRDVVNPSDDLIESSQPPSVTVDDFIAVCDDNFPGDGSSLSGDSSLQSDGNKDAEMELWLEDFDKQFQDHWDNKNSDDGTKPETKPNENKSKHSPVDFHKNELETEQEKELWRNEFAADEETAEDVDLTFDLDEEKPIEALEAKGEPAQAHEVEEAVPKDSDGTVPEEEEPSDRVQDLEEGQLKRWNRQLGEHQSSPFPPGYGEDLLFGQPLPSNDPRDRWERENKKKKKEN